MAMTAAGLSAKIISELGATTNTTVQKTFADALAKAIVEYIQQNAVVSTPDGPGTIS